MASPRAHLPSATRFRSPDPGAQDDQGFQREVRSLEPMDIVISNTSSLRCLTCRKDRQKCTRKEAAQPKCDRCLEYNYFCAVDDANAQGDGKRRKLQRLKCELCRSAKVKCEPTDRVWPEKCNRCKEKNLQCSEPQVSSKKFQIDGRTAATPQSVESSDESPPDHSITIRSKPQIEPKTRNAQTPSQNWRRPRKMTRPRLSDVVDQVYRKSNYVYSSLMGDEIRLLVLQSGWPGQELRCFLVTESLQQSRPYQALSYLWGSDPESNLVKILNHKAPAKPRAPSLRDFEYLKKYIKSNLFEALQALRKPNEELTLFVNAICINHEDKREKCDQSLRTQEIFQRASGVLVWLGKETATSKKAFDFIPKALNLTDFSVLLEDSSRANDWIALTELMRNPLFGRRWLIQELAVAKKATLCCGEKTIEWSEFSDAVVLFETNLPKIQRLFASPWMTSSGPMDDIHALGASKLVSVVSNIVRKTPDEKTLCHLETLESLVSTLSVFENSDPLDTLIAIIGLAKDKTRLGPIQSRIDQNQGVLQVFIAFVRHCVSSGSIDIICRHWAPEKIEPNTDDRIKVAVPTKTVLPSWIPNVSGSAFGTPGYSKGRVNGDSFVGLPDCRIYNAAFGFPPADVSFGQILIDSPPGPNIVDGNSKFDGTMNAKGYMLDVIADLGPRAAQGLIHRESLEMGGWIMDSPTVPERLWRTLVADRGHDNTSAPSWFQRACLYCLNQSDHNGDFNTTALLNKPSCPDTSADFLRRVQSVTWNRKFLLSKSEARGGRLFGLAPACARSGDIICILYGCSVPVVLREHVTADDRYFEVIGESFIYGMMDGEARMGLSDEELEAATMIFKLR